MSHAVVDPRLMQFLRRTPVTLVGSMKTLLARAHHHCSDVQHRAAIGAAARRQRPIVTVDLIEMIDNGVAIYQVSPLSSGQADRWPAPQRGGRSRRAHAAQRAHHKLRVIATHA
jgi:hypothetical protein